MTSAGKYFFEDDKSLKFWKGMRMGRFRNFDMADVYESAENLNVTKTATS